MISAIIVNHHTAHLTNRAVRSVFDCSLDVEVFVVDNSCSDDEFRLLKSLLPPQTHLIINEKNIGFAKACNLVLSRCNGNYVLLLNPDAYLLPLCLERLVAFLKNNPCAAAVGPKIYWDDRKRFILPINYIPNPWYDLIFAKRCGLPVVSHFHSLFWRRRFINSALSKIPLEQECLSGGSVLINMKAIEMVGGMFDERYFMYYEDADLFQRLRKRGFKLFIDNSAEAVHNWNQSPSVNTNKVEHLKRSRDLFMQTHFPLTLKICNKLDSFLSLKDRHTGSLQTIDLTNLPKKIDIPRNLVNSWVFEWSPNPNMFPSAMMFSQGEHLLFETEILKLFKKGVYYGRISSPKDFFVTPPSLAWQIQ